MTAVFAKNSGNDSPSVKSDTLQAVVVTGTRQEVTGADGNPLMPVLMDQVPGLFVTSRGSRTYEIISIDK